MRVRVTRVREEMRAGAGAQGVRQVIPSAKTRSSVWRPAKGTKTSGGGANATPEGMQDEAASDTLPRSGAACGATWWGSIFWARYAIMKPVKAKRRAQIPRKGGGDALAADAEKRMAAEERYITGSEGLRTLGEALQIPQSTLARWSKEGGWTKKRKKYREKTLKKAVNRAGNRRAGQLARMLEATGSLENALIQAAAIFEQEIGQMKNGTLVAGKFTARNLESLAKAMNATAETRMLISGIMTAAEQEKLKLLQQQARAQKESRDQSGEITVQMAPEAEEMAK